MQNKKFKKIKKKGWHFDVCNIEYILRHGWNAVDETGCGSAWLERLIWDQEVAGSNPVTPTMYDLHQNKTLFFEYESVAQLDRATAF